MYHKRTMPRCVQCDGELPRRTHNAGQPRRYCTRACMTEALAPERRFAAHTVKSNDPDECHRWIGALFSNGYGVFGLNGKNRRAHVIAHLWFIGSIPDGFEVCHTCPGGGNRWCVNPRHLLAAPHTTNMQHAIDAGRTLSGSKNPKARLTEDDVREIRRLGGEGVRKPVIAVRFGISAFSVYQILRRLTWKHVI